MKIHTYWRFVGKKSIKNTYIAVFGKIFEKKNSQVLEKRKIKEIHRSFGKILKKTSLRSFEKYFNDNSPFWRSVEKYKKHIHRSYEKYSLKTSLIGVFENKNPKIFRK